MRRRQKYKLLIQQDQNKAIYDNPVEEAKDIIKCVLEHNSCEVNNGNASDSAVQNRRLNKPKRSKQPD